MDHDVEGSAGIAAQVASAHSEAERRALTDYGRFLSVTLAMDCRSSSEPFTLYGIHRLQTS
jgi:hypothetical protein